MNTSHISNISIGSGIPFIPPKKSTIPKPFNLSTSARQRNPPKKRDIEEVEKKPAANGSQVQKKLKPVNKSTKADTNTPKKNVSKVCGVPFIKKKDTTVGVSPKLSSKKLLDKTKQLVKPKTMSKPIFDIEEEFVENILRSEKIAKIPLDKVVELINQKITESKEQYVFIKEEVDVKWLREFCKYHKSFVIELDKAQQRTIRIKKDKPKNVNKEKTLLITSNVQ
ncbi:hypothetical protein ABK040_012236 [Willaertia magna]